METAKRFPIQEDPYYGIYPGKTQQGNPVIAFVDNKYILMVYFAFDGKMLNHSLTFWTCPIVHSEANTIESRQKAWEQEHDLTRVYLRANGFASLETVEVQKFWVKGAAIGITQYPAYFTDVLEKEEHEYDEIDPAFLPLYERLSLEGKAPLNKNELVELREDLERWRASGDFVLYHGNDYWCHADGEIHSS